MKRLFILFFSIATLMIAIPQVSAQAFSVSITSSHCEYVVVSYTTGVDGGTVNLTTNHGGSNSANSPGAGSLVITFPMQSEGTAITVTMTHNYDPATATSASVNCTNSYGEPPTTNPGGEPAESIPPWEGEADGRLNPDPAEFYTIYCQNDYIDVYVSNPETDLIKRIPIYDAIRMYVGDTQDLGDNMSLVRNTGDTFTIYGSNGNTGGEGEKAFSLDACIEANGGEPPRPTPEPTPYVAPDPREFNNRTGIENLFATLMYCISGIVVSTVINVSAIRVFMYRVQRFRSGRIKSYKGDYDRHRLDEIGRDLE